MINKLEELATKLIPFRKWLLAANIGCIPVLFGLLYLCHHPIVIVLAFFSFAVVFFWSMALYIFVLLYNLEDGPFLVENIKKMHPFFCGFAYIARYAILSVFLPAALILFFSLPFFIIPMIPEAIHKLNDAQKREQPACAARTAPAQP